MHTILTPQTAQPVAGYQMGIRHESGRLVFLSAREAVDAHGNIVGKGDIRAQTRYIYQNLRRILQSEGGNLSNLIKITTCALNMDHFSASVEARTEYLPDGAPAATVLEVPRLAHPDALIQVEAIAIIDERS